ncbi:MAG: tripartite tricarboxylate transporter TctB family protein [Burkholderiaceae bacterium]
MKVDDALIGAVLLLLSLVILWHVSSFPPVPGQPYGSSLFPMLAAAGMGLGSLVLTFKGWRERRLVRTARAVESGDAPTGLLPVVVIVGAILFYIFFVDTLGFIVCGILILTALMLLFRVPFRWIVPVAVLATLVIHTGFYRLLKVPLPWGVLSPVAW